MTLGGGDAVQFGAPDWGHYRDRRAARRAAARRYHPDMGGSADAMIAAFIAIDAHFIPGRDMAEGPLVIVVRRGAARRLRMALRRWYRRRRAPRYFSI